MIEKFIISFTRKTQKKLDKLILENCPDNLNLSRTKIQDLIRRNMIFDLNEQNSLNLKTKTDHLEQIILYLDTPVQKSPKPENLNIPIVFEDSSIVVFNKPSNMIVHPVKPTQGSTLVNFLMYKYQDTLPKTFDKLRPGIVHRLDKDTSGLIIVAKTVSSANSLTMQFRRRLVKKIYLALCIGNPLENLNKIISKPGVNILDDNVIEVRTHITRNKINREMMQVNTYQGKLAISRFSVKTIYDLGSNLKLSLVSCEIETGRTHQIRLHAKHIGCPVFGDNLYRLSRKEDLDVVKTVLSSWEGSRLRQMLHAHELSIIHPESGKSVFLRGDLPLDFANLLSNLEKFNPSHNVKKLV